MARSGKKRPLTANDKLALLEYLEWERLAASRVELEMGLPSKLKEGDRR